MTNVSTKCGAARAAPAAPLLAALSRVYSVLVFDIAIKSRGLFTCARATRSIEY